MNLNLAQTSVAKSPISPIRG